MLFFRGAGSQGTAVTGRALQNYSEAIAFLFGRVNYERTAAPSYSSRTFKLDRMAALLSLLGDPQERIETTHIAGTKGKGSTATMFASILTSSGIRTGLFTSPHLVRFEERFRVDGQMPTESEFLELMNRVIPVVEQLDSASASGPVTYFEIATALGWLFFEMRAVDHAVLEVGLGGRLDSTNVCAPVMTIITSIGLDHTALLGDTVDLIAREKAGILKTGVPLVCGVTNEPARTAIEEVADSLAINRYWIGNEIRFDHRPAASGVAFERSRIDVRTPVSSWSDLEVPLPGRHQAANASLAVSAFDLLAIDRGWTKQFVADGLAATRCSGRIEVLDRHPTVILDVAHNVDSIQALLTTLETAFRSDRIIVVFATSRDKDARGMLRQLLSRVDILILTEFSSNPRSMTAPEWETMIDDPGLVGDRRAEIRLVASCQQAWQTARSIANAGDLVCATGSFFLIAELQADSARAMNANSEPHV